MKSKSAVSAADSKEMATRINGEVLLLLGWSRAILLQLAHPLVASGVADHSSFNASPRTRVKRLRETIEAMLDLTFGTQEEAERAAAGINAIHDRVHGQLKESTEDLAAGSPYSAHDPDLLSWVHLTLLDSLIRTYELYVGPLSRAEKDRYCLEARSLEPLLGIPQGYLPDTFAELESQFRRRLESSEIEVTKTARRVAQEVVWPDARFYARPLLWLLSLPTIGLLPPSIREAYGFSWGRFRQVSLEFTAAITRTLLPWVPSRLRYWPRASGFWFGLLERSQGIFR